MSQLDSRAIVPSDRHFPKSHTKKIQSKHRASAISTDLAHSKKLMVSKWSGLLRLEWLNLAFSFFQKTIPSCSYKDELLSKLPLVIRNYQSSRQLCKYVISEIKRAELSYQLSRLIYCVMFKTCVSTSILNDCFCSSFKCHCCHWKDNFGLNPVICSVSENFTKAFPISVNSEISLWSTTIWWFHFLFWIHRLAGCKQHLSSL